MMKKAQGMSLNVIIIAVIALIILIVLVVIFAGKAKLFSSGTAETSGQYSGNNCEIPGTNNKCMYSEEDCSRQGGYLDDQGDYEDCRYQGGSCCRM